LVNVDIKKRVIFVTIFIDGLSYIQDAFSITIHHKPPPVSKKNSDLSSETTVNRETGQIVTILFYSFEIDGILIIERYQASGDCRVVKKFNLKENE
jgi:hypothetical protein|tara:strand:- start:302 stop:589 length:288 start_codon:yes stop_codon:yes gene_type:complete